MELLTVENLHKTFHSIKKEKKALNGMSFSIKKGETVGFLGPNGAGKSTTIKIMMDLIKADKGRVLINRIDSTDNKAREHLGFLPENPSFVENLTGMQTVMFAASMHNIKTDEAHKRALQLLKRFNLSDSVNKPVRTYSKGMLQKLGIITAIIHQPEIIILDEPMSGLDPIGRYQFKNQIKELNNNGATIFFSSHIIPDIEDLCSRVIIVNKGAVIKTLEKEDTERISKTGYEIVLKADSKTIEKLDITENISNLGNGRYSVSTKNIDLSITVIEKLKKSEAEIVDIKPIKNDLESLFIKLAQEPE